MSTTDPTGEGGGGGGGGGEGATTTNVEQNASPSTPIAGSAVPAQPAAQQQQQQQQQHPPPSPLSGCYLLVVLPEPHTAQHKDLILNRLAKGFLSWDKDSCHVDLEKELLALVAQAPEGEEARNGERLIQYATENLVTEVLIHPQTNTLLQCIRNLLASFTKHRHIIHAGYTFGSNGSWILQDGTFSLADFLDAFSEHEVQRVLRAYENSVTVDIHCAGVGDWTTSRLSKEACCRSCRVRVNPDDVLTAGVPAITSFTNYIGQYLVPQTLDQLMEPSDVVGNIRFSHPTLYVFPGGQGDAALFGINGFNMLVDGGFARKACFWDFTRHLDRLDAVLVTRINNSNIGGMFSLCKKKEMHVYPQIGHFFCNLIERRQSNSPDGDKDIDPLIFNLTDIGQEMVLNLRHISLRTHPCYRNPEPINLYHKVGHGTLDMYVLNPSKDSREVREFMAKWHASDSKLFAGSHKKDSNNLTFPIQNLVSICALLVWQPANPEDNITRILFPGSTPQHKIFEGFERLKHLDFLKHPVCSAKTLSPSTSLATLRDKPVKPKFSLIEKEPKKISELKKEKREPSEPKSIKAADETVSKSTPQSTPIIPTSKPKAEIKTKKVVENKKIESEAKESKKIEKELKEIKKEPKKEPAKIEKTEKPEKDDIKKTDLIKPESEKTAVKEPKEPKESKPKFEPKKKEAKEGKTAVKVAEAKKSEAPKPKLSDKRAKPYGAEKKDAVKSSPTTPKKTLNGAATKTEITKAAPKAKPAAKVTPSLPAKSAKEANNRKVVEQKKSEVEKSAVKDTAVPAVKAKPKPMDRKPISRRAKPVSPSKPRMPGSPAKSTRSTPTASVKSDKDGVIRKVKGDKGTTDSSTVSTPSGIEPEAVKPIDKSLVEQSEDISLDSIESKVLADLKEEREVVEEIEAVLQKAERIEETRKDDRFEGDDEITAEATDKKEEDITEEDVTAEIEDVPKKEGSRKESQELTEEDEYLIVEKEEVYTEDSAQSGEGEQKHVLDEAESEKAKVLKDVEEKGEKEEPEEKGKDESPEKKLEKIADKGEKELGKISQEHKEQLQEEVKEIIASAAEIVQKAEEKDDSGKKDSEDITKEPSSLSPDKLDSSEKKTTDTDMKPDVDQKDHIHEKMEESQERISTIESGATTTAPTLPEDEKVPLDEIKEDIDEKHVIEEVKEKDAPAKLKEEDIPEVVPAAAKPEVKVFDVRQAMPNLQRDIVKTPDEVADLPVHEEVDPKLYRMEDFEKGKEEKPSPTVPTAQDVKEPPTPPTKEQKGVFSFFGKVADKFEKGIDKLTKKTKKDGEKDSDDKSSKSSSPKEVKVLEKTVLEEVDMEKMFPKVGKSDSKPEIFEEAIPTIADVKVAAIKETAAFIQGEILDAQRRSVPDIEEKLSPEKLEKVKKAEAEIKGDVSPMGEAVLPKPIEDKEIAKEIELLKEEEAGEDVEEVKALLEEASKKFKTVKDSLRDSLESLEDKIKEEEIAQMRRDVPSALKDVVKDTLAGVAEKLVEIEPEIVKEPEKVKFAIPKDEEFEEEYEEEPEGPYRDMKEGIRDVGEVLAGSAGILLDDKPKDVTEIVKKVAEVLREDDLLSEKALFGQTPEGQKEEISPVPTDRKPSISSGKVSPEKDTKPEEEEPCQKLDIEVTEEPCVKVVKEKDDIMSPVKDVTRDKRDAQRICAEMLEDDQHICDQHKKPADAVDASRVDVLQAGVESVCVREVAKRPSFEEIEQPVIGFEQKVSPAKAEIVMVTPGSTPTSPKFTTDKMYDQELTTALQEPAELPEDVKQVLGKEAPVEEIIEELIITKKKKITIEIIEYITVVKRIPKERVIYIIEEIIVRKGLPRETVVDDPEILKLKEPVTLEKRLEVEEYIVNEYIVKGKRITIEVIEEISIKKVVPQKIVVEIIEEIIVKRKIARHMVLDVPEDVMSEIIREESPEESPEESIEEQITPRMDISAKRESTAEVPSAPTEVEEPITPQKQTEIENFIVNEYVIKGKRITASIIDEISAKKTVPKRILIEIIEEIIIKKKIPRSAILDVTEEEISAISKEIPEDEEAAPKAEDEKRKSVTEVPSAEIPETKEEPVTPQKRAEVEEHIFNEYIIRGDSINVRNLEEICNKKKVPKRIIIEIIEEIIIKRKMPRYLVISVPEEELLRIIEEEAAPEPEVPAEKRKSVAEMPSPGKEKISPVGLKEDEEHKVAEEDLPAAAVAEEEDVEEEVDGFVSIPRRVSDEKIDAKKKADALPLAAKEHEKDVIDDFEAVEQEYKVRDVPVTSPEKATEMKEKEDTEETAEDTTSDVIEADEKFVQETKEKVGKEEPQVGVAKDVKPAEKREPEELETSEISEIIDTVEKYLDEAKEKTDDVLPKEAIAKSASPDEAKGIEPAVKDKVEKGDEETNLLQNLSDLIRIIKDEEILEPTPIKDEKIAVEAVQLISKITDAISSSGEPEVLEDDKKPEELETTEIKETPEIPDEALRKKRSISREPEDETSKDESRVEDAAKSPEKSEDEKLAADKPSKIDDLGTVMRMLVTASSEDGREETEICPTGSITFTKIVTPDDSLKDASIKSTPDKDSLLDKESVRSGASTPEKDSISEKSAPEGKGKISPDDSLEKSPVGTRDSQDLEDSLEKSETRKPKMPEKLDDVAESKSPAEKEDSDKIIAEKEKSKSPEEEREESIAEKSKSGEKDTAVESIEKPKLPIEKVLPESEKEKTTGAPKTPESLHSEDVSPAETIFSKSPTDKPDMCFAKMPISEEDVEAVGEKSPEPVADKELPISSEKEKSRSPSISGEKPEDREPSRSKSPSIAGEQPEDKSRSPSIVSVKAEELKLAEPDDKIAEKSRSSSITAEKLPEGAIGDKRPSIIEKETIGLLDKSRSPSIASDKGEKEDTIHKSRSPSIVGEPADKGIPERSRSPSIADKISDVKLKLEDKGAEVEPPEKPEEKDSVDRSKSPSVASEKSEDIKFSSVLSDKAGSEETDKPKSPSAVEGETVSEKSPIFESGHYDEKGPIDEAGSPSAISDKSDERKQADRSKSPSIAADKPDLQDVTERYLEKPKSPIFDRPESPKAIDKTEEPQDKDRSPSVASDKSDSKKVSDRSRSPSISVEKVDSKHVDLPIERSRSPSVKDDKLESVPKDELEFLKLDEKTKDITQPSSDKSKSPSPAEQKLDAGEKEPLEKSRSPSVISAASDLKEPGDRSKSPSIAGEKPDEKDVLELTADKSRSGSVASFTGEKEADRSKSPSVAGEKPDLKDVAAQQIEKSPSVLSVGDQEKPGDEQKPAGVGTKQEPTARSKSPSIASEKSDSKKSAGDSKASSVAGETADLKDVLEPPCDKSRSSSVTSATADQREPTEKPLSPTIPHDGSKSPSVASEKSDDKKSVDGSKAASVTEEKPDLKDVTEEAPADRSRSPSVATEKAEPLAKSISPTADGSESPVDRSKSPVAPGKLDIRPDDVIPSDRSRSPSIVLDKPLEGDGQIEPIERTDVNELKTSDELGLIDKTRSLSIISDKTEPKSDASKSPSLDGKDKSRSSSVASERLDDADTKISPPEAKRERSVSSSLDAGKPLKDESAKSSRTGSPVDKSPKDRSRSQSIVDAGEKSPASRSRTASLFEEKSPEKAAPQEGRDASAQASKPLDEKDEGKSSPKQKSPITSPEAIQKEMQKIREKRFADFEEPDAVQPAKIEKLDDEEEVVVKVTAEKRAEIEKYILEEFITRRRKISLAVIEKLVMMYSVPRFIVMEIIEDIISRQNVPRDAVFDFADDEFPDEEKALAPQKRADVEKYITDEFIAKKRKITPETLEEIVILKAVPRYIVVTIIEEIIVKRQIPRNTVIEGDLREKSPDVVEKREKPAVPTSVDLGGISFTEEHLRGHEKPKDTMRGESPGGKVSPAGSDRDARALSASPSLSPEPIPSDKSTQDSPRSEPHIDEEILISEEKRTEIEQLLEEEYIKKGRRITEEVLEEIIIRTSLPRYIILEIVEEIILKKKIPRESVIDVEIYQEEEPEDYEKTAYDYDRPADVDYELPRDGRKPSVEYRMGMYPETSERQADKPVADYPMGYESQFHKAFVGGMTEIRTTHITTLSGKSTPEFAAPGSVGVEPGKSPLERPLTTTHITKTDVDEDDSKTTQPVQTVTLLRESKIGEPQLPAADEPEETAETEGEQSTDDIIVMKKIVKREMIEEEEPEEESPAGGPEVIAKEIKRPSVQQDEPEAITKIIKREIVEHDEPEVVTKVVKREIIEQDEPEVITKVIRREIVVPDEEGDSKDDSGEYVKTITTRTTRTIVTEELPDDELSQVDPSKIYTDPTSGATYRVVSDESAPDATAGADVKRIVTTVTTITGPDGKVTTKKDVKESTDTVDSEELLEKLIDSGKITTETTKSAEKIIKETITTVTSGTSTPDVKAFYDSGKSTPDLKHEEKVESAGKERLSTDKFEHSVSPLVRDLISDDKSYSGKSSPDISLPKDIVFSGSTGKSTPEVPMSPLIRDGAAIQHHLSGRSTPDRRSDGRSSTGTPEGFRSGEMIRTTITTTKTISDEGEIVTTTREVTETTNEKGETVVLAEKTDVKVDERLPSKDAAESAISSIIGSIKSSELQRGGSPSTDDEPPHSSTSQAGSSSQAAHHFESTGSEKAEEQIEFSAAAMSGSFYGELPAVPPQISAMKTFHGETGMQKSSDPVPIHSRFMVEKEFAGGYAEKPDAKRYVDEADLDFDKALMDKEMKEAGGAFSSGISPRYTNGSLRHEAGTTEDHPSSSVRDDSKDDSKGDSKKDPLDGWGSPLGLPSPKPPRKFNLKSPAPAQASCSSEATSDTLNFDVAKDWGEPLRLPSPAPVTNEVSNKGAPSTPKKERKQTKKVQSENIKNKKRSESPGKNEKKMKDSKNKVQPVYMDLAYVPHYGNSYYTSLEFFKRVRARYYVFSGTEPSREVYDALLEAKKTWEDKDLEVTMIPTYDTDTLGYWVADNEEALAANHIDLSPSASRCTINLQDHETSCSAYRLEF